MKGIIKYFMKNPEETMTFVSANQNPIIIIGLIALTLFVIYVVYVHYQLENHPVVIISKYITKNDFRVMLKIKRLITNPKKFFEENKEFADYYDFDNLGKGGCKFNDIFWLMMPEILEKYKYTWGMDLNIEVEEFVPILRLIKNMPNFDETRLKPEESIIEWAEDIDYQWLPINMCLATIDIGGDCCFPFACEISKLEYLNELAKQVGYKIEYVRLA